jgi:RsiW-degrading membrane proteinase PrsW (M82 family)
MSASTTNLLGMGIGGAVIASLGVGTSYANEQKIPSVKSIVRDFIIGAVLVLLMLQLLPDSVSSLSSLLPSLSTVTHALSGGGEAAAPDMDIQVGIPKF